MKIRLFPAYDGEEFLSHLEAAFGAAGLRFDRDRLSALEGPEIAIFDGRQLAAQTPRGEEVPRPMGLGIKTVMILWVPAPMRLEGVARWAQFVQGPRALLLAILQESQLTPFRA
jgi:hypothetical protein